jgi:pyruvate/2-oxoacid:ferredoxin oxidoreductase alpha subunit
MKTTRKSETRVITGNAAAAHGVALCRPDIIALYPITPQTELVEQLSRFHADGVMDAEMIEVEGENSAMNAVLAASCAGARTFTATSSYGLAFMFDALLATSSYRAPVVMANVNRETPGIHAVSCGQQDLVSTRDTGWIQVIAENCQEVLDSIVMAFKLAEDYDIQLPVMVNYDGFYLSHLAENVAIPARNDVDEYLSALERQPRRTKLEPGKPMGCGTHGLLAAYSELRYKHCAALQRAKAKFDEIDREFQEFFGRGYGGQIEEYQTQDADILLVASGSAAGTARTAVDAKRVDGLKVGLVKVRMFRPFPRERLTRVLKGRKAIGVLDRSVSFGWSCGPFYMETRAISADIGCPPMLSFIDGLANMDITVHHIEKMIDDVYKASQGEPFQEVTWMSLEE